MKKAVLTIIIIAGIINTAFAQVVYKFNKVEKVSANLIPLSLEDKKTVITYNDVKKKISIKVEGEKRREGNIDNVVFETTDDGLKYTLFICTNSNGDGFAMVKTTDNNTIWIINKNMSGIRYFSE